MGDLLRHLQLPYQIKYVRCYLKARTPQNTYHDWVEVSRWVIDSSIGTYSRSIDTNDFDVSFYEESNITLTFDNSEGSFNEGRGFFEGYIIDRSRIKIEAGYRDIEDPESADFDIAFEGIIDDRGTSYETPADNVQFTVLALSSIIGRLKADYAPLQAGDTFGDTLYNLLNVTDITQLLTVDLANINPSIDEAISDETWFQDKQLKEAIDLLLLVSNSVMTVTNNTIYINPRAESDSVRFEFWGNGSAKPCNIEKIQGLHSGLKRVITRVMVNSTIVEANYEENIRKYGARLKTIDAGFISDSVIEAAVAQGILDEFAVPKQELDLTTDYLGNEVDLLDLVTIDQLGAIQDSNPAFYGQAVYGTSSYVTRTGGVRIRPEQGYKILSISHDYQRYATTLKLRAIGNKPYDSYL